MSYKKYHLVNWTLLLVSVLILLLVVLWGHFVVLK